MATYTTAECDSKIAELEAALDELALLPVKGTTGKTTIDLTNKRADIQERLEAWTMRRAALANGGVVLRTRREC